MTGAVRFETGDHRPSVSALTVSRSLEDAFSQCQFASFEDLAHLADSELAGYDATGALRFTGYLEQVTGTAVSGYQYTARSKTIQLDRYDALGNERYRRATLESVLRSLALIAGVEVGAVASRRVARFRIRRGDSFRTALQRLAEVAQVVITDDAQGRIRAFALDAVGTPSATWCDQRDPVTRPIEIALDYTEWRYEWICRGHRGFVGGDLDGDGKEEIRVSGEFGVNRGSRRVLDSRAAASKADAALLVDWTAKKHLARVARVTVPMGRWPADPGDVVRVRVPDQGVDDVLIVQAVEGDLVSNDFQAHCAFPDAYQARTRLRRGREVRPQEWRARA